VVESALDGAPDWAGTGFAISIVSTSTIELKSFDIVPPFCCMICVAVPASG
jgi:hypothetical protein